MQPRSIRVQDAAQTAAMLTRRNSGTLPVASPSAAPSRAPRNSRVTTQAAGNRTPSSGSRDIRPAADPSVAPSCAIGPALPTDPPVPMQIAEARERHRGRGRDLTGSPCRRTDGFGQAMAARPSCRW